MNSKTTNYWMVWITALFITFMLHNEPAAAVTTYYVDDDESTCPGTGTTENPFCKIQDGIDAAVAGDTVQVASGTYYEHITMKSGVIIQGAGAGDNPSIHSIIDGSSTGTVVTASGVDSAAKLDGFKITNGHAGAHGGGMYNYESFVTVSNCIFSGNTAAVHGGGMFNNNSSPMVTNCTFSNNTAGEGGGGMRNDNGGNPSVIDCIFTENSASQGGGMSNWHSSPIVTGCQFISNEAKTSEVGGGGGMDNDSSSPTLTNCTFSENTVDFRGGGIFNTHSSSPTVTKCTFSGNTANYSGGGMYNSDSSSPSVNDCMFFQNTSYDWGGGMFNTNSSSPVLTNCTFIGNTTPYRGGGMCNYHLSSPTLTNCTFSGNTAQYGGGMSNLNSSPTVTNCILWGNSPDEIYDEGEGVATVTYSNIRGGYAGTGNINADPEFVDPDNGNLHLKQNSQCIDAGNNGAPYLPEKDMDGDNRKIDNQEVADTGSGTPPIVDMGADEYYYEFPWELFYPAFMKKK